MEHLAAKLSDDRTRDREAFYEHLEQVERLIGFTAFLLIFVTVMLLCALYGRQTAAYAGLTFLAAMVLWRRQRIRMGNGAEAQHK
jgi:hypothetical protein